jgi:hypothetical protein
MKFDSDRFVLYLDSALLFFAMYFVVIKLRNTCLGDAIIKPTRLSFVRARFSLEWFHFLYISNDFKVLYLKWSRAVPVNPVSQD